MPRMHTRSSALGIHLISDAAAGYPRCIMEPHPSRDQDLEDVVDELQDAVTNERQAQGLPGNAAEREQTPREGSDEEPPD